MKQFNNIDQVWNALNNGKTIYWNNTSYKVYIENAIPNNEYQKNHFTNNNGKILSIRCISNYFGSLMESKEVNSLFIKE